MSRLVRCVAASIAFMVSFASCGGEEEGRSVLSTSVSCLSDSRVDTYGNEGTGDLEKPGERAVLSFRFFDLEPSPPAKGNNTFHVQLEKPNGDLVEGGLGVDLRMPDHGHGTSVEPVVTPDPALRTFTVTPLNLFMPGVWRLEFEAFDAAAGDSSPADIIDRVALHFCIEG